MTHLTSDQLVDAAEGRIPADLVRHLDQCETCRADVTTLGALLASVGETLDVPEPSPLFWEHLSRRVREATAIESVPAPERWWRGVWRPVAAIGAVGAAIAFAVVVRGGPVRTPTSAQPAEVVAQAGEPAVSDDAVDVVTAVAGDLSFDELRETDLIPRRGTVDLAVSSLTEAQRRELMRLVREELVGSE